MAFWETFITSYRASRGNRNAQVNHAAREFVQMPIDGFTGSREYTFDTATIAGATDMFKKIKPQIHIPGVNSNG